MATSYAPPILIRDSVDDASFVHKFGVAACIGFVFLFLSRIMDLTLYYLHLPLLFAVIAIIAASLSGALFHATKTRVGALYGGMALCMLMGVPFSVWRGGSLETILTRWFQAVLVSMLVLSLMLTFKAVAALMNTIAIAVLCVAVIGLRTGVASVEGRLIIGGSGRIANPNDLAFVLMLGLPLWWRFASLRGGGLLRKVFGIAALATVLVCFLKTGSRGGLLGLVVMLAVGFWRARPEGKATMIGVLALASVVGSAVMPGYLKQRYFTFWNAGLESNYTQVGRTSVLNAVGSTESRTQNLIDSLKLTLHHPLFGVGAGNFAIAQNNAARAAGLPKGSWLGTHNTYTQLSSECGVPVLILFVALLGHAMRSLWAARRLAQGVSTAYARLLQDAAVAAEMLLLGVGIFILFYHVAYDISVYLVIGTAEALARAVQRELAANRSAAPTLLPNIPQFDARRGRVLRAGTGLWPARES
jgi:hypothetical protein